MPAIILPRTQTEGLLASQGVSFARALNLVLVFADHCEPIAWRQSTQDLYFGGGIDLYVKHIEAQMNAYLRAFISKIDNYTYTQTGGPTTTVTLQTPEGSFGSYIFHRRLTDNLELKGWGLDANLSGIVVEIPLVFHNSDCLT
jgi:hypothetical protein